MSKKLEVDELGKSYPFLKFLHKTSYSVVARDRQRLQTSNHTPSVFLVITVQTTAFVR
jgi:hypothetical protein